MATPAPTWILLRGLAHEAAHWGDFPGALASALNVGVNTIDLPGTGRFRDVAAPTSVPATAQFVWTQISVRAPPPYYVMAVSFGGMVALDMMRQHPGAVTGAVLLNTSVGRLSRATDRLRWQTWPTFLSTFTQPNPRDREVRIAELVINDPEARARAVAEWARAGAERPVTPRNVFNQLLAAARARPPAADLGRALILNGLGDRLVDPSCSTALAAVGGWPLRRHPWAGHDLIWDDPDWVLRQVREWLG